MKRVCSTKKANGSVIVTIKKFTDDEEIIKKWTSLKVEDEELKCSIIYGAELQTAIAEMPAAVRERILKEARMNKMRESNGGDTNNDRKYEIVC